MKLNKFLLTTFCGLLLGATQVSATNNYSSEVSVSQWSYFKTVNCETTVFDNDPAIKIANVSIVERSTDFDLVFDITPGYCVDGCLTPAHERLNIANLLKLDATNGFAGTLNRVSKYKNNSVIARANGTYSVSMKNLKKSEVFKDENNSTTVLTFGKWWGYQHTDIKFSRNNGDCGDVPGIAICPLF